MYNIRIPRKKEEYTAWGEKSEKIYCHMKKVLDFLSCLLYNEGR